MTDTSSNRFGYDRMLRILTKAYGEAPPSSVQRVLQLAVDGHRGQFRTTTGASPIPFIVHPVGVALLVIQHYPLVRDRVDELQTLVAVALAHDLIEDTRVDGEAIEHVGGALVRRYVEALTKQHAGIVGTSQALRNEELLERIREAGPSAAFVKLCDSMHNVSRPNDTPPGLYSKALHKAEAVYGVLVDDAVLGTRFAEAYASHLRDARDAAHPVGDVLPDDVRSLDEAIRECVRVAKEKPIELHDLSAILTSLTGASECVVSSVESGEKERPTEQSEDASTFRTQVESTGGRGIVVNLVFQRPKVAPSWISDESLAMFVRFLLHRVLVSAADARAALAVASARQGMEFDVDAAARLGIRPGDILELAAWQRGCSIAAQVVASAAEVILLEGSGRLLVPEAAKVSSRVKTADSIMEKCDRQKGIRWPHFWEMEDIAGVRVVCAVPHDVSEIERHLSEQAGRFGIQVVRRLDYYADQPESGYRAIHLILDVAIPHGKDELHIPCEVQLRTAFQDIWAAVSQQSLYKMDRRKRRRLGERLRRVSDLLEESEHLAQDLLHDTAD